MSQPEESATLTQLMENLNLKTTSETYQVYLKHPAITKVQSLSKLELNDGIQKQLKQSVFTEPVRAQIPSGTTRRMATSRRNTTIGRAKSQVCLIQRKQELREKSFDDTWIEYLTAHNSSTSSPNLKKSKM